MKWTFRKLAYPLAYLCILYVLGSCGTTNSTDNTPTQETTPSDISTDSSSNDSSSNDSTNQGTESDCAWPEEKYISVNNVHEMVTNSCQGLLLLNVVDEEFYNLGHIEGSVEIPWDTLEGRLDEVDKEQNIVVYCRKGVRSESAYTTLETAGYSSIVIMEDGIEAWIAAGYEVESIE